MQKRALLGIIIPVSVIAMALIIMGVLLAAPSMKMETAPMETHEPSEVVYQLNNQTAYFLSCDRQHAVVGDTFHTTFTYYNNGGDTDGLTVTLITSASNTVTPIILPFGAKT